MPDKFDDIMRSVADEADARVDYDAMREAILRKNEKNSKRLRARIIRYGSMAAALAILLGAGAMLLKGGGGANTAESAEMSALGEAYPEEAYSLGACADDTAEEAAVERETDTAASTTDESTGAMNDTDIESYESGSVGTTMATASAFEWTERGFALPEITFGESVETESDDARMMTSVSAASEEDFRAYIALLEEMYPSDVCCEAPSESDEWPKLYERICAGWCKVTLTLGENGSMTVEAEDN